MSIQGAGSAVAACGSGARENSCFDLELYDSCAPRRAHSVRIASRGSTRVGRWAGRRLARSATAPASYHERGTTHFVDSRKRYPLPEIAQGSLLIYFIGMEGATDIRIPGRAVGRLRRAMFICRKVQSSCWPKRIADKKRNVSGLLSSLRQ